MPLAHLAFNRFRSFRFLGALVACPPGPGAILLRMSPRPARFCLLGALLVLVMGFLRARFGCPGLTDELARLFG
jgi:hypothetical protein